MDLNHIRIAVTVISLGLFLVLMAWTWWPTRRGAHAAASLLPFEGEAGSSHE